MSDFSPNLDLPFLLPNQAQKHVTMNDSLAALDVLVQLVLETDALSVPPPSPEEGTSYAVAAQPEGAWTGQAGAIASWQDGVWSFHQPQIGWRAWNAAVNNVVVFDGAAWLPQFARPVMLGINAIADDTNRLIVRSAATLLDQESGDHRLKVNKAAISDTASLVFQANYVGHAEFGLTGDNRFRIKTSADGASWVSALTIKDDTGHVGVLNDEPRFPLEVGGLIGSTSLSPGFYMTEADQPADRKTWRVNTAGGNFFVQTLNDIGTSAQQGLVMTRDGIMVDSIRLMTDDTMAVYVGPTQNVAIGHAAPTTRLHVNGPVRLGQYAVADLPAANAVGAGTVLYVTNVSGGAQLAFSDGTVWRNVSDRSAL